MQARFHTLTLITQVSQDWICVQRRGGAFKSMIFISTVKCNSCFSLKLILRWITILLEYYKVHVKLAKVILSIKITIKTDILF